MNASAQQIALLRNLKGAPLSIIWALLMANMYAPAGSVRALQNRDLETWTGYSDKPVASALGLLHTMGMVAQNGGGGWYLTTAAYQLPLPLWLPDGGGNAPLSEVSRRNSPTLLSSSSSLISMDPEEEETEKRARARKDGEFPTEDNGAVDNSVDKREAIRQLLLRGGVGANSRKMGELLNLDMSVRYVEAHVLERLYQARAHQHNSRQPDYPVGWLINRLLCGDPSPQPRCPSCLQWWEHCYCEDADDE